MPTDFHIKFGLTPKSVNQFDKVHFLNKYDNNNTETNPTDNGFN